MSTLESYLTTIADAIREKKGTTEPINASNFASEILSIQGGGSLNLAYGLTPPTDTSKIWLQCAEPQGVEVQNYLGKASVSEVANYGGIDNPVSGHSDFISDYYSACYIGNNQIAIVGYNHIRIYDLTSKSYISDYTISVGTSSSYTNVLSLNNILYFGYNNSLYSYNLSTQTLTTIVTVSNSIYKYIFFNSENEIDAIILITNMFSGYRYRYNLTNNTNTSISSLTYNYINKMFCKQDSIKVGNIIYRFLYNSSASNLYFKIDLVNNTVETLSSFGNFVKNTFATDDFKAVSVITDSEERYVYLIGGGEDKIGYNHFIKYDTVNDTFEKLGVSLLGDRKDSFSLVIDNRVYIFGGQNVRKNRLDYFDISYPLNQNNAILTINNKTDNNLPLINTDKLKINSNIASAYLGNANNLAEKVNAYYWNGTKWVGINCEDYTEPESGGTGGGLNGGGDVTTDPEIPVDKPVEI